MPESVSANDIKIFFIDCFDTPIDDATARFFDNHQIYRIVLPKIKTLLRTARPEPSEPEEINKWLFESFLLPLKMKFNQRKFKKRINRGAILYGLKLILCPGNIFETQLLRRQKLVNCFL